MDVKLEEVKGLGNRFSDSRLTGLSGRCRQERLANGKELKMLRNTEGV